MTITYRLHGEMGYKQAIGLVQILSHIKLRDKVLSIKLRGKNLQNQVLFKSISIADSTYFNMLAKISFIGDDKIRRKFIKPISNCLTLRDVMIHVLNFDSDESFIAIFLYMREKLAKKVNITFTRLTRASLTCFSTEYSLVKATSLLCTVAKKVENIFITRTDNDTNKLLLHLFLTTLEVMNRKGDKLRGVFLGYSNESSREPRQFEAYAKLYPLAKYTRQPRNSFLRIPFNPTIDVDIIR